MENILKTRTLLNLIALLRWNKPSGRLILLIPAGWSLYLTPNAPPEKSLILLIICGGLFVSGAGCIANDLWDMKFDKEVERTKNRPLANESVNQKTALTLLFLMLFLSLLIIGLLPEESRGICLILALFALPPILLYPTTKRWFPFPQVILSICWGFSVLIPWAASESKLQISFPLILCWVATCLWTFGFDTIYAMADSSDDKKLGLKSSVISLKDNVLKAVSICYALACIFLGIAALKTESSFLFWPIWFISSIGMQRECFLIKNSGNPITKSAKHFKSQVLLGALLLLGLIISRTN